VGENVTCAVPDPAAHAKDKVIKVWNALGAWCTPKPRAKAPKTKKSNVSYIEKLAKKAREDRKVAEAKFMMYEVKDPTQEQIDTVTNAGDAQSMDEVVRAIKAQALLNKRVAKPTKAQMERVANAGSLRSMKNAARAAAHGHKYWCDAESRQLRECPDCNGKGEVPREFLSADSENPAMTPANYSDTVICMGSGCSNGIITKPRCYKTWNWQYSWSKHSCDNCDLKHACTDCMEEHVCPNPKASD